MGLPSLRLEKKLWRKGFRYLAGIDESGLGSLAGPIVAAVVIFGKLKVKKNELREVRDSKLLSSKKRERLSKVIKKISQVWTMAKVSNKIIDKVGLKKANLLVFKKAVKKLKIKPDYLIVDGKINLESLKIPYSSIVDADAKIFSCSAASILAKVFRDSLMVKLAKKFPAYRFAKHKGYGTKEHYYLLRKYGPCSCHRKSFRLK